MEPALQAPEPEFIQRLNEFSKEIERRDYCTLVTGRVSRYNHHRQTVSGRKATFDLAMSHFTSRSVRQKEMANRGAVRFVKT